MKFTGERYIHSVRQAQISYYHWHRYLYASHFCANKTVLDIACGEGYGCDLLSQKAQKVIGVDIDAETIQHAQQTYKRDNLEFICGIASQIPVVGEHVFDLIVSFETIEHISEDDQKKFLQEVKRLLKPDGVLLISTPDKVTYSEKRSYKNPFHLKEFSDVEFHNFLMTTFVSVNMLRQHIYPASFIWEDEAEKGQYIEHKITLSERGFSPSDEKKATFFLIAFCSNSSPAMLPASHLLDLSSQMLSDPASEKSVQALKAQVNEFRAQVNGLEHQLQEITNSKAWALAMLLRRIRIWFFPAGSVQERFLCFVFRLGK